MCTGDVECPRAADYAAELKCTGKRQIRKDLEQRLGRPIITSQNAAQLNHVVTKMLEASVAAADETGEENGTRPARQSSYFVLSSTPMSISTSTGAA